MSTSILSDDSALLPIPGAVLYDNVYGKGDIANYRQLVFRGQDDAGWEWDWPESAGPHGLAQPTGFLATAELGSEVADGKGRTTLRVFRLRQGGLHSSYVPMVGRPGSRADDQAAGRSRPLRENLIWHAIALERPR
jgi:hypothetical protein